MLQSMRWFATFTPLYRFDLNLPYVRVMHTNDAVVPARKGGMGGAFSRTEPHEIPVYAATDETRRRMPHRVRSDIRKGKTSQKMRKVKGKLVVCFNNVYHEIADGTQDELPMKGHKCVYLPTEVRTSDIRCTRTVLSDGSPLLTAHRSLLWRRRARLSAMLA